MDGVRGLFAVWTPAAMADVFDDAGVKIEDYLEFRDSPRSHPFPYERPPASLAGIPLSAEHEAAIRAGLPELSEDRRNTWLPRLLEERGEFAKALEALPGEAALDRVRLLVRLGREAEVKALLSPAVIADLGKPGSYQARQRIMAACRPLEDLEQWEQLDSLLRILGEQLSTGEWQAAVWMEQLDLACHHGRIPQLLESAAGDPVRLCLYLQRLGNRVESERLAGQLTAEAGPVRLAELLSLAPFSPSFRSAAAAAFQRQDLSPEERVILWEPLSALPPNSPFGPAFLDWLAAGGDASPLAERIWKRWGTSYNDSPERLPILEALVDRFPQDPRFNCLLARQIMDTDPARAAGLFATAAASPLACELAAGAAAGLPLRLPQRAHPSDR